MSISFDHATLPQRVVFGTGRAEDHIVGQIRELGADRVLLIANQSSGGLADALHPRIPVAARIGEVVQHVPAARAAAATSVAAETRADVIVSIGGGSATGLAKIVALRTGIPIVAVPTTFAGSEATNVWGITEDDRKTTGTDPRVLPAVIVYDAALSASLPQQLAISSGLNAIAHAVDGFWAPRADPINRALGTEGLRALVAGLRGLHAHADDLDAREQTLYGAYLSAVAFASAGSGLHHKICHVLGGRFNLPHAETHAVVLRYVTALNAPDAPDAAGRISAAFGGGEPAVALFAFGQEIAAPQSLGELGLREQDIAEAAALTLPAVPGSNPHPVGQSELEQLLHDAWAGTPILRARS